MNNYQRTRDGDIICQWTNDIKEYKHFNKIWTQLEGVNFFGNLTACKLWFYILLIFQWFL